MRTLRSSSGQVLAAGLVGLLILLVLVPLLVYYVNREAGWSVKEKRTTIAFHLADAAVDRGRWKLLQSISNWNQTSTGTISGYNFDQAYTDIPGGSYAIKISSDSTNSNYRDIDGVGKDSSTNEVRKIHAIFRNDSLGQFATRANQSVSIGGSTTVEWSSVVSGQSISGAGTYPRYYSAGNITPLDSNGPALPNTDNVQWWSYYSIPPAPSIDFTFYESSASSSGSPPAGCPGSGSSYLITASGTTDFNGCQDTSGKPYVFTQGNVNFKPGSGGNFIVGSIIAEVGTVNIQGNGGGSGSYSAQIPPYAWQEYGNAWSHYRTFDSGAPGTYAQAVNQSYVAASTTTYGISNVVVHGFVYAGSNAGLTGGGSAVVHGVVFTNQNANINSGNVTIYYDNNVAVNVKVTKFVLTRIGWYEVQGTWPSGI